jgi:hypothetical protein
MPTDLKENPGLVRLYKKTLDQVEERERTRFANNILRAFIKERDRQSKL